MPLATWFGLFGFLCLLVGFSSPYIRKIPVTSAMIYLTAGMILGPSFLQVFHINPLQNSSTLEIFTEIAVLISLFSAGVKMPVPFNFRRWEVPIRLAFLSMAISVALVTLFCYYVLHLPVGFGVLLGAIVAPTDPVLATDVQIRHPGDEDPLRFTLTSEAGMNDGSAFPFVVLGIALLEAPNLSSIAVDWVLIDLLWSTASAIFVGVFCGYVLAKFATSLHKSHSGPSRLSDLISLGLIGIVYGISLAINAWGFLAVFIAAIALRQTENKILNKSEKETLNLQDETLGKPDHQLSAHHHNDAKLSEASLIFKEHLERLSEIVLVLLIGGTLFIDSWSYRALALVGFIFFIARPVSVLLGLLGTKTNWRFRLLTSWFGVRGIGSLYYLMYAIQHGVSESIALELVHFTLILVTLSIFLHGLTVKPLLHHFWKDPTPKKP